MQGRGVFVRVQPTCESDQDDIPTTELQVDTPPSPHSRPGPATQSIIMDLSIAIVPTANGLASPSPLANLVVACAAPPIK